MKHYYYQKSTFLLFVLSLISFEGFSQTLEFTYDSAGNQIQRELVTLTVSGFSTNSYQEDEPEQENVDMFDFNQANVEYFPNPVEDLLNVRWDSSVLITKIYLFSSSGQLLQIQEAANTTSTVFDLSSYSSGMYHLVLHTVDNQQKTYKIIKK